MDASRHTDTHVTALDHVVGSGASAAPPPLGVLGERLAARHLVDDDGLRLLARNWRIAYEELRGELDLVALDPRTGTLVACEVKTRRDAERFGGAVAALPARRISRLRLLVGLFARDAAPAHRHVRLDLVAVDLGRRATLTHVPDVR